MATPIVTGIAAILKSYFPQLTATDIKSIIEQSVFKPDASIACIKPGSEMEKVPFEHLSKTGGIVNAYNAVKTAMEYKPVIAVKNANVSKK